MALARIALLLVTLAGGVSWARVMQVHRDALVVDLHADTLVELAAGRGDLASSPSGHIDLPRLQQGGLDAQVFAAFVNPKDAARGFQRARELIAVFHNAMRRHPSQILHARTVEEIETAHRTGRVAGVLAIENGGDAIQGNLDHLDTFYRLGVRMMGLTWNLTNALGDGALEQREGGLTPLGRQAVARMQALGIVIDVSHLSPQAFWHVLEVSKDPFVASHSDAMGVHRHPRNLTDAQLRAMASRGAVVGVNFYPTFLGAATLERVLVHIDHMVKVMGVEHVALGSDFDGINQVPQGLEDVSRVPNLTRALLDRGYTPEQVRKILGENALRVFRQVWGR